MDQLGLTSAHVVGWSDGGNVGLELAFAHPDRVKKLVTFGANYTHEDWMAPPDNVVIEANDPLIVSASPILRGYREGLGRMSPNVKKKLDDLMERYPNFTTEQLKAIPVPVLVVVGDHDVINLDQTITMFGCLPHAQLFIVPGATHFAPLERPELVNREVIKFLSDPYRDIDRYYWLKLIE
jgi:pimeloyl-ACP methyl ester carboxylesterase